MLAVVALVIGALSATTSRADDPDFLAFSTGWFDFNRKKDQGGELRLEYRLNKEIMGVQRPSDPCPLFQTV